MIRTLKTLGLILTAVLVMSSLGASAASAATTFHASNSPVGITGTQTTGHVFTTNAGTVTCTTAAFTGAMGKATQSTITMTADYTSCKWEGFVNLPMDQNGCAYVFYADGETEIECPTGKAIEWTLPGCTTRFGPQNLKGVATYTTAGAAPGRHMTVHSNIAGITYDECGTARSNGTLKGVTTVKGQAGEIWVT